MEPGGSIYKSEIPFGKRLFFGFLTLFLLAGVSFLVRVTEGEQAASAAQFYYIPIILAAFYLEELGGILVALIAAFLAMVMIKPDDTMELAVVIPLVRAGFFFVIAGLTSRLASLLRQRTREFATLYQVANHVASSLRLEDVLRRIAEEAQQVMHVKACSIRLFTESGDGDEVLPRYAAAGLSRQYFDKEPVDLTKSMVNQEALQGRIVYVENARTDKRYQHHELAEAEGITSVLALPLTTKQRVVGVIKVYNDKRRRFNQDEVALLMAFASQAAIAIENAMLHENVRAGYYDTVRALSLAIEAKDPEAMGHTNRVLKLMLEMARRQGLDQENVELIKFGTMLHDIGKIGISEDDALPFADQALREEYTNTMHALIGASILEPVRFLHPVLRMVRSHHERLDGSGYPEHLTAEDLDQNTRMIAIVDQYDSWVNGMDGPAWSPRRAIAELMKGAGSKFDAELVRVLKDIVKEQEGLAEEDIKALTQLSNEAAAELDV